MSRFSLRRADKILRWTGSCATDRGKGIVAEKIAVIPPWSQDGEVRFDATEREQFRKAHGLQDKFV